MRKLFLYYFIFIFLLLLPSTVKAEEILNFESKTQINEDSSILVEERINYDFGNLQKHGIYREIPYKYKARGGNYNLEIKVLSVADEGGHAWDYSTSRLDGNLKIKIGSEDKYAAGQKTYIITYHVQGAINYFDEHDELYWNVTGNDWQVPISSVSFRIILPKDYLGKDAQKQCFTGALGSTDQNCTINFVNNQVVFRANNLQTGDGLSVVTGFKKSLVTEPSTIDRIWKKIKDNLILLLPIIVFIFLFLHWKLYGKDPIGRGTIMPEYEPPENILPAEAGVVIDEKMDLHDVTATIIDLARRGYFKIKEIDKEMLGIKTGKDWQLINNHKSVENLVAYEKDIFDAIFSNDVQNEVGLSKIKSKQSFAHEIKQIKHNIYENVVKKSWFVNNPNKVRAKFMGIGIGILIFIWIFADVIGISSLNSWLAWIAIALSAALFIIFGQFMPKKTKKGAMIKERLSGFKMFLSATEKNRVKFHFSPKANPEKFALYLPWAIIFKVEKEWAKVFQGINLPQPDWYTGSWAGYYTAFALTDSLRSFDNSLSKGLTAAGAGAARGVSGFGGSGFSGGGFGGGGGGSW